MYNVKMAFDNLITAVLSDREISGIDSDLSEIENAVQSKLNLMPKHRKYSRECPNIAVKTSKRYLHQKEL
jgi:hypothetical protein